MNLMEAAASARHRRWPVVAALAVLAALLGGLALTLPPAHAISLTNTAVSLTFDDGNADQYAARSILSSHGMRGTFFVNSGRIDTTAGFLTLSQLRDLASDGNEVAGHTVQHADLTTLGADEARREVCNDRVNLFNWGFAPTDFAYPYGHYNADIEQIAAACGYNSARQVGDIATPATGGCSGCPSAETIPPADPYATKAPDSVDNGWTLSDLERLVTDAEQSGGGWVQLTFHHVCDGCASAYATTPATFSDFLDWLRSRAALGTTVQTVQQVIGGPVRAPVAGPVAPVGQPLQNASLEVDANGDGTPDCWSTGTFGSNSAAWARTSDAHSGSFAERVDITSYTSGDRKLVVTQDLGACAPSGTPGHRQLLTGWYKASSPTQFVAYYRDQIGKWFYWTSGPAVAATSSWTQASWTTPPLPSQATAFSFGLNLAAAGSLTVDDFAEVTTRRWRPTTMATPSPTAGSWASPAPTPPPGPAPPTPTRAASPSGWTSPATPPGTASWSPNRTPVRPPARRWSPPATPTSCRPGTRAARRGSWSITATPPDPGSTGPRARSRQRRVVGRRRPGRPPRSRPAPPSSASG